MAAYAALVSLRNIIDQIQNHPRPPISLNNEQVESLTETITFLQEFLEDYSHDGYSKEPDTLEMRIADAAYAAEDVIESHVVNQIHPGSTSHGENISSVDFYQGLGEVIENMDSIRKEAMEIRKTRGVQDTLQRNSTPAGSVRSSSTRRNTTMVGFDDVLIEIMDKLAGEQSGLQVIPIVGMGGIGKTTLTGNIYENKLIREHFDIRTWATISQEYNIREILREVLCQVDIEGRHDSNKMTEEELGGKLHKHLWGRRYLTIIDDLWNIEAWNEIKNFFPDNNNGSRIVITSRQSDLGSQLNCPNSLEMKFLDVDKSWDLFCKTVFGEEGCPFELVEIGKKIVRNCKGLPLSIVTIGGLLAKSKCTREYWEYIMENLNPIVNTEDDERCFKILHMSYNQLPMYLKPCFLYMGVFNEDRVICVSMLIKLWVAEGFLKPISGKSLEVVAKEYLNELINRNLILVHKTGFTGNTKYCQMHDLLRDLCLKEAQRERFYNVIRQNNPDVPQGINIQRRVVIRRSTSKEKVLGALQSMPLSRSLICDIDRVLPLDNCRLLRILKMWDKDSHGVFKYDLGNMSQLINTRYLAVSSHLLSRVPSSIYLLWNLQTLIVQDPMGATLPTEIWNMPQLRHVQFRQLFLEDPPSGNGQYDIVLGNLQTVMTIINFRFGEEMIKRIPNIKKLGIKYISLKRRTRYYLNNLGRLHHLESLSFMYSLEVVRGRKYFLRNLTFPHSLKKLTIGGWHVHWKGILKKIGSLPLLEKLTLKQGSFKGHKWDTVEGQFCSLKFLLIWECSDDDRKLPLSTS